ncbi:kinase-like domain-containing protein [Phycomyces nitens]|nr:kinase-like domain-containing protein [Phycomyces nitens]
MSLPIHLYGPSNTKPTLPPIAIHPTHPYTLPSIQPLQSIGLPSPPQATPLIKQDLTVSAQSLMHHRLHPGFLAKYALGEELGSGGFGFVVSAHERRTGIERAVKFIFRHKVPAHAWVRDVEEGPIPMEIYVLKNVRHPGIIGYVDSYQDDSFFYLVMELHGTQWSSPLDTDPFPAGVPHSPALSQTSEDSYSSSIDSPIEEYPTRVFTRRTSCDLFECIERHHNFEESLAKDIFRQIVECVAHLDSLGICHRDIKDENIVIDDRYKVKLIDFGSAVILPRHYGQNKPCLFNKFYGTISFASPEILMRQMYRAEPAEVWSLGVLLYTILFGEVPFHDPQMAISGRFAQPKIKVSSKCLHLVSCMLERSPDKRPSIHQILSHPWFRD